MVRAYIHYAYIRWNYMKGTRSKTYIKWIFHFNILFSISTNYARETRTTNGREFGGEMHWVESNLKA